MNKILVTQSYSKEQIETLLGLEPLTENQWETFIRLYQEDCDLVLQDIDTSIQDWFEEKEETYKRIIFNK